MYISGRNSIIEAIRAGEKIEKIYVRYGTSPENLGEIRRAAKEAGIAITTIDRRRFAETEKRAQLRSRSQGLIARIDPIDDADIMNVIASAWETGEIPLVAALDGVTDPHNIGAIVRSVSCAGLHGLVVPKSRSGGFTDVVARSSAGAMHSVAIDRVADLSGTLSMLRDAGLTIYGCDESSDADYTDVDMSQPAVLVFGSEGEGISPAVRGQCDAIVAIPMTGPVGSLNVSVAAGVVMFEARRQRAAKG